MSKGNFDSILDECLQAMARGESLESCLARYPKQAQELRGLLSLAQNIRHLPLTEPSGRAQAAAWQRFYRRSSDLRAARRRPAFGWLKPVAIVAAVLLALIAAGGGTIYAASRSLPDSPLYPVKLFSEEARLWFVFDDLEEADILLSQAETRIDEIRALLQEDKPIPENVLSALRRRTVRAIRILEEKPGDAQLTERARQLSGRHEDLLLALWQQIEPGARDQYASALATLHNAQLIIQGEGQAVSTFKPQELVAGIFEVSGAAQPSSEAADVWNIGGVDVLVDGRTLGHQDIASDRLTKAVVARGADGLHALKLTVGPQEPAQENVVISGIVEAVSDNEVRVAGQSFALTEETLARLRLQLGRRVEVTVSTPDGQAVAAEVKPLPAGGAEAGEPFAYEGTIEGEASLQREVNNWLVGGQPFIVPQNVAIDALAGPAAPGARVRVEAVRQNGNAVASRLVVLASERPSAQVSLEGVLENVTPQGQWQVSGFLLEVDRSQSPPPPGTTVKVQGRRQGQAIKAESFLILQQPDEKDGLTKVSGFILQVKDDRWRVGIVNVALTDDTEVNGEPIMGARALVWGRPGSRGSLEAVYIDVLDSKPFISSSGRSQQDNPGPSPGSGD